VPPSAAGRTADIGTLSVDPTTGTVDDAFAVTGTDCFGDFVVGGWTLLTVAGDGLASGPVSPDQNGAWSDGIPAGSWSFGPGEFQFAATCDTGEYEYAPVTFTVTEAAESPATTVPPAPPPVPAAPTFTG
jgi:hypothetical protein